MDSFSKEQHVVLVVDDEPTVLAFASQALRNAGFTVLAFESGVAALEHCHERSSPIHLALLDIVMPRMNGFELRDRLQGLYPRIRVMFMSGFSRGGQHTGFSGATPDFLPKPFTAAQLVTKVRSALQDTSDRSSS